MIFKGGDDKIEKCESIYKNKKYRRIENVNKGNAINLR